MLTNYQNHYKQLSNLLSIKREQQNQLSKDIEIVQKELEAMNWNITHPIRLCLYNILPLELINLCLEYVIEKWCEAHCDFYLGSKCRHCITPKYSSTASTWIVMEDIKLSSIYRGDYLIFLFPIHEDDIRFFTQFGQQAIIRNLLSDCLPRISMDMEHYIPKGTLLNYSAYDVYLIDHCSIRSREIM